MPKNKPKTPSYRLHKGSGQAVVTLGGKDIYLGKYGTKASKREHDRIVAEWLPSNSNAWRDAVGWLSDRIKSSHIESYFEIYCHDFTENRRLAQMTKKDRYEEDRWVNPIRKALIGPMFSEKRRKYRDFENDLGVLNTPENVALLLSYLL